jgi:NADPH2:quinone reductase
MADTMRAIRVSAPGGSEALRLESIAVPEPGKGQVLVRVEAAGVNFIDVYQRQGFYPVPTPFTLGQEGAGVVLRLGPEARGLEPGCHVAWTGPLGAYAEYAAVPLDRLVVVPEGVKARDAAALMLQGMTAHYLTTATYRLRAGDWCVVHAAAGGVGLLLCQMARLRGARVFGTVSTAEKAALARSFGADEVMVYGERDLAGEVRRVTAGGGAQVVYDGVGQATWEASLASLAPRGMLVLFGQSSGPVPPLDPLLLSRHGSIFLTRPKLADYIATRPELEERAGEVLGWARDGRLKVKLYREYPLEDAAEAHRDLESRRTTGKLLLIPG